MKKKNYSFFPIDAEPKISNIEPKVPTKIKNTQCASKAKALFTNNSLIYVVMSYYMNCPGDHCPIVKHFDFI